MTLSADQFRQQKIGSKSLYHGTPALLAPGDVIRATPDRLYGGEDKAYATTNLKSAGSYAGMQTAHSPEVYPQVMREEKNRTLPLQGQLFAPVYEVNPLSHIQNSPSGSDVDYTDTAGFRVKGVAAWQRTDDMNKHAFDQDML